MEKGIKIHGISLISVFYLYPKQNLLSFSFPGFKEANLPIMI